jgi:hypothetical protein
MSTINGNEPLTIDTKTHRVKKPVIAPTASFDVDFTGLTVGGVGGAFDTSDFARISLPNDFAREQTFSGLRLGNITIKNVNYTALPTDAVILMDCTGGDRIVNLPNSNGNGQLFTIWKTDTSDNIIAVKASTTNADTIDGIVTVVVSESQQSLVVCDAKPHLWKMLVSPLLAYTNAQNVFTDVTVLKGLRVSSRLVTDDYSIQPTDFEIVVDATAHDINLTLPPSAGNGQVLHVKKIDTSFHNITLTPATGELIDGATSLTLGKRWSDAMLIASLSGSWDNTGPTDVLILPTTPPTVALLPVDAGLTAVVAKQNEVINQLINYGLFQ